MILRSVLRLKLNSLFRVKVPVSPSTVGIHEEDLEFKLRRRSDHQNNGTTP